MILAWILFSIYLIGTAYLGWLGHQRTKDFSSFAIGQGDLSPVTVGVTLAAATASAATFIINPGFVYVDGLSAFMHLGISVFVGFVLMLSILSFRFRKIGEANQALTVPDWIGKRYGSKAFALYFAFINLLTIAFIVLLVGGISIVMQKLLGVSNVTALLITLVFVTGYVLFGGTYAHVFTNMFQGFLMIGITVIILGSGIKLFLSEGDFWLKIQAVDPNLLKAVNPESVLFNDLFSTYIAGFCIGAALVCQPHILTKALYVKSDRAVRNYILVFSAVFFFFCLLLLAGFWAHLVVPADQLNDPVTGAFRQDLVMTTYLQYAFPDWIFTIISVVLLAAAMSTLDGLLVGISTITANDLVLNLADRFGKKEYTQAQKMKLAFRLSHLVLILIAVIVFLITLHPPKLLGIFGQTGVYGLVLAAVPPLLVGVLFKKVNIRLVWSMSVCALILHFGLFFFGQQLFPNSSLAFGNPGVTATIGLLLTVIPTLTISSIENLKTRNA
ncbi:MAG: cation acetate symporter [Saprospiraceae bacterium]|nr:MAG: cation acetate symporter [Saprospiraceae bacterium]